MRRPSILRDSGSEVIRIASQLLSVLIITPILIKQLHEDGYGVWKFIEAALLYFVIFEPSLRGGMVRFLAEAIGRHDRKDATTVVTTCAIIIIPLVSIAVLAAFLSAPLLMSFPKDLTPDLRDDGILTTRIMSVVMGVRLMSMFGGGILNAAKRIDLINLISVPIVWINLIATLVVLSQGGGLVAIAILSLVMSAFSFGITIAVTLFHCKKLQYFERRRIRPARIPGMFRYIFYSFISKVGDALSLQTPILIYAAFFSIEVAAIFAVVRTVETTGRLLTVALLDSASPRLTATISNPPAFKRLMESFTSMVSLVTFSTGTCFMIFAVDFISLWSPLEDPDNLVGAFVIWKGLELVLINAKVVGAAVARSSNNMEIMAIWTMIEGIICLGLSLWLAHSIGPTGPIVAIVLTQLIGGVVVTPLVLNRLAGIPPTQSFSTLYFRPIIGCLAGGGIPFATLFFIPLTSWPSFIGAAILGCALVGAGGYAITLQREQRSELWNRVKQIRG